MALFLLLLFLAMPVIEIYLMIQVGAAIGAGLTVGLLVLSAVVGAVIIKREGIGMLRRVQTQFRSGSNPGNELLDGALVVLAGALLVIPGFISDAVALVLLVGPVRRAVRSLITRKIQARLSTMVAGVGVPLGSSGVYTTRVVEDLGDITPPQWQNPSGHPRTRPDGNELRP